MTTATNTTPETPAAPENFHFLAKVRTNLETLGRNWATYSLEAGKLALETSAGNLKSAADYLADLMAKLQPSVGAEGEADAEAGPEAKPDAKADAKADAEPAAQS
ncbi:hypothetical protein [Haliangium sp.]|uniref:hypothetical protein n=1 Tax=Haliangium sp. TaxID=2663208 RepID=UPI003D0BCD3D